MASVRKDAKNAGGRSPRKQETSIHQLLLNPTDSLKRKRASQRWLFTGAHRSAVALTPVGPNSSITTVPRTFNVDTCVTTRGTRIHKILMVTILVYKRTRISRSVLARVTDLIGTARTWEIKVTVKKTEQELSRVATALGGVSNHLVGHTRRQRKSL